MDLKKWLRSQDCYDADLEKTMTANGIKKPEEDFKNLTEAQWDEMYRVAYVQRCKDLKDQAAKQRLEKKMAKIEKYWRKVSGIKKSSQTKKTRAEPKPAKAEDRMEAAAKKGAGLKKYMQKEEIWDKDLFLLMVEAGVKDEVTLGAIDSQKKFDNIVRELKVLRQKDLKSADAQRRVEKTLSKLEKLWREKTGIQKTSIQDDVDYKEREDQSSKALEREALANAQPLKKYMQAEQIWDKDLFVILYEAGVKSENSLTNLDSEDAFDEVVRQTKVVRAADIKDADAKARLEKTLAKLEKLWRAATGIQKTSVQADVDYKEREDKSSKSGEREALAKAGELKVYMRSEEFWDKDLFMVLVAQGVYSESGIANIDNEKAFDEVIRQVKVARQAQLKDAAAQARLEKLLARFEKQWRDVTGIKKTSVTGTEKAEKVDESSASELTSALEKAGELKKYMRDEQIWDKDLFLGLVKRDVVDVGSLAKIDTQDKFDDLVRETKLARAEELKGALFRSRMEKTLVKFEKLWRALTGIKPTSIQQGKDGSSKGVAPADQEVETLQGAGKELRLFLQTNDIWDKDLHSELLRLKVNGEEDLGKLTQAQFDEVVRKVRVQRFTEVKDQGGRNRLDKKLVAFEKMWSAKAETK